jgi:hypothetical protein
MLINNNSPDKKPSYTIVKPSNTQTDEEDEVPDTMTKIRPSVSTSFIQKDTYVRQPHFG